MSANNVNTIRFRRFADLLSEKIGHDELGRVIEEYPAEDRRLLRRLETQPWMNRRDEVRLIAGLAQRFNCYALLEKTGRDCMVTALSQAINTLPKECGIVEVIYRIPSFAALFMTDPWLTIHEPGDGVFRVQFSPGSTAVDLLFLTGIISALFGVFEIKGYGLELVESEITSGDTNLPAELLKRLAPGINSIFEIRLPASVVTESQVVPYDRYAQQVLKESARVLEDNRDLQTAVEYLNIANRELEKKIQVNKQELDMARSIQKGFVPPRIPDWNGLQFWVKFFPLAEVSGDFYDYFYLGSNKFGLLVADVSGHGVPAALISAIAKFSFNSNRLDSPSEVLEKVNLDMINYVRGEGYLTSFFLIVDHRYNVTYSVAAFPNPILYRMKTGEVEFLAGSGTLLGIFSEAGRTYSDLSVHLDPGDKLFIFSDGIIEASNVHGEGLGDERLLQAVRETKGMDVQRSSEHVMGAYHRFIRGTDPTDDLTLVTVMLSERLDEFNELMRQSREARDAKKYDESCNLLKSAISIFPRQTNALFRLGRYLAIQGRYEESLDYLKQYNLLKPYNADSYRIMGFCFYKIGNFESASESFKRSLGLRAENPSVVYNQIKTMLRMNHIEEANSLLEYFEQFAPNHPLLSRLRKAGSERV